jgi:beta-galactosidase
MELDWGQGRLTLCTLDLEDHVGLDPAAAVLARNLIRYAATTPRHSSAHGTTLLGDEQDRKLLDLLGVKYATVTTIDLQAELLIVGRQAACDDAQLRRYLQRGGQVLLLARSRVAAGLGVELEPREGFAGSLHVPSWTECRGLGASDLRWRSDGGAWLVKSGAEVGAEGLLGRMREGKGVAVFCQLDPEQLEADSRTYFRLTRWRQTRALSQLLANLGASFEADESGVRLKSPPSGLYHPDYRQDFENGDDPYRYFRW